MPKPKFEVKVGQVWRDNDIRSGNRMFEITCIGVVGASVLDNRGHSSYISLKRLRPSPSKRGYSLIQEAP